LAEATLVTPGFRAQAEKFPTREQELIWKAVTLLMANPDGGGLNPEPVKSNRDYWSFRAGQDIRIFACRANGTLQLVGVDHHNKGYEKAERGAFGGAVRVPALASPPKLVEERPSALRGPLQNVCDDDLTSKYGVPVDWIAAVRSISAADGLFDIGLEEVVPYDQFFELAELFPKLPAVSTGAKPVYRLSSVALTNAFARGEIADLQFNLPTTSWAIVESTRKAPILVKGGPGSGKTLIALYRALHVLEEDQGLRLLAPPRVLYVTYTSQLRDDARNKIERLRGNIPQHLTIETYDHFTGKYGTQDKRLVMDSAELTSHVRAAAEGTRFDAAFVKDEIESVIQARNVRTLDEYQQLRRRGRGAALGASGRIAVWRAYERYRAALDAGGIVDLGIARMRACDAAVELPDAERYDFVIVDEVQDLQVSALMMTVHLARGQGTEKHVMLVGDAAQTIHSRGFRWVDVGLRIGGGNVYSLTQSERSTQQILDFARALFAGPDGELSDDIHQIASSKSGGLPRIVDGLPTDDALYAWVVRDVEARHGAAVPWGSLAVVAHSNQKLAAIEAAFKDHAIPAVRQRDSQFYRKDAVKLITAQSAKGLEFSEVYVPDANDGVYPYFANKQIADPEDRAERDVQDCKLLYVAATRAGNRLTVLYVREPSPFVENARALAESTS
jgi:superfamily I DNA/RNA helicase